MEPDLPEKDVSARIAELLNSGCSCVTLDRDGLYRVLAREVGDAELTASLAQTHPSLFSSVALFLPGNDVAGMEGIARAIEAVAALPAYREAVLAHAPEIASFDPGPAGALMGYDFHLSPAGPRLIEVNTNAGGAFLNALLARAQRACCAAMAPALASPVERDLGRALAAPVERDFERAIIEMFQSEWTRQRGAAGLRRIAIVDDAPTSQYLYPELRVAAHVFRRHGIAAIIAEPAELAYEGGRLHAGGEAIDLVYNRLVDFALAEPGHAVLRAAYLDGAVVVTPNPRVHALLADKRNLTLLSDGERLRGWGVPESLIATLLAGVPRTVLVTADHADELWAGRKALFFKPARGYGSKAAYRGDKLTRSVWSDIVQGEYVAQSFAPPGERVVKADGSSVLLKSDIRLYTYDGETLLMAARLYQGQTTNFRTPGGGFAPVFRT
jgi:hypothetical protein